MTSDEQDQPSIRIVGEDWPAGLADRIVNFVEAVRSNTTDRVVWAARMAVYGLVAMVATVAVLILVTIALVRIADAYLPIGAGVGSATWAAHGFIGLLITVLAFGVWLARSGSARPVAVALIVDAALIIAVVFYGVIRALV